MSARTGPLPIAPGRSLADLHLGASIHEVLCRLKQNRTSYPVIDLHYSNTDPLTSPVVVSLPKNGLRLQFDGSDQRLRLIEVMDFKRVRLSYKGSELARASENADTTGSPPSFKRIYQIFGASYPGEYLRPKQRAAAGTYVLSWAGIAFTFPLQHSAWSAEKDHVSLLGSSAASPATHMAIFEGSSWPEVRRDLFTCTPSGPRSSALTTRGKDALAPEIEQATVHENGVVDLARRAPAAPFTIVLNQTTPQDLVTELGRPDATHKRDSGALIPPDQSNKRRTSSSRQITNGRPQVGSPPSSYSSTGTDTFDTDFDSGDAADDDPADRASREVFWCYFSHGMDILIGPPTMRPQNNDPNNPAIPTTATPLSGSSHLVVQEVILHGNVPGSYAFNRHRRLRWTLALPSIPSFAAAAGDLNSETHFEELKPVLLKAFEWTWPHHSSAAEGTMGRGKVVNRTWGGSSPSDSSFFLPDAGEDLVEGGNGSEQWLGNTRLFGFPGLVCEVLENGAVGALTVY